jgi:hypothetical protein
MMSSSNDLSLTLEMMRRYGLKINSLKCVFSVLVGNFLGSIIHENGVEMNAKKIDSIQKVHPPQSKKDMQKFLGKLNHLRRFIFNLSWKISAFVAILRLKNETDFTWGEGGRTATHF